MNWLKNFKCKTIIYATGTGMDEILVVDLIQAKRVNRLRRQLLFKAAVKSGSSWDYALKYCLANGSEIPKGVII